MKLSAFQRYVLGMVALVLLVSPFFVLSPFANAQNFGLDETARRAGLRVEGVTKAGNATNAQIVLGQLIGTALSFVGIIFLILMIYGGILWMTAGGTEEKVTKAKNIMTSAIIGLVLIFAAYAITAFVTGQLGSAFGIRQ